MNLQDHQYLYPSSLAFSNKGGLVSTVLGSCVSVCLFDPVKKAGGINHFMLPLWNGKGLPTPKYGNIAIEKLIENLTGLGCRKEHLQAKVFGGAQLFANNSRLSVGERNIALAFRILEQERIPVIASSTGGKAGRKIFFNMATGEVLQSILPHQANIDLHP